jgi:hypothetical protein
MNWKVFKEMTFKQQVFTILVVLPLFLIFMGMGRAIQSKLEEKKRYKRVIKKGILWDTEYLVERD